MAENHEREQEVERDSGHDEEIEGNQVLGVILENGSRCLGARLPVSGHVFGHGCLTHVDSNPQQFPMTARSAPSAGWRGSFDGSDCELTEIQPGDHGHADFSNHNRGERSCDPTR